MCTKEKTRKQKVEDNIYTDNYVSIDWYPKVVFCRSALHTNSTFPLVTTECLCTVAKAYVVLSLYLSM